MKKLPLLTCLLALLIGGCGGDMPSATSCKAVLSRKRDNGIAVREFICANESPKSGYGAYGYVLLTERPGDQATLTRYTEVYAAFTNVLESVDDYVGIEPDQLLPTFWLLSIDRTTFDLEDKPTPSFCVQYFDYVKAKLLLHSIGKTSVKGPILVAWNHSFEEAQGAGETLVLDLSDFSDADMKRAIRIWAGTISKDPAYWNSGFKIVKLRELFRNFLNTYGENVLAVITPS